MSNSMRAIVTFQGFTESNSYRTGTEDLYWTVIRQFADGSITTYQPQEWTANVKRISRQLARQGVRDVALVSYSHGQAAAVDFARYAYGLGITVTLWLACDPIYRAPILPRLNILQPLAAWSLTRWATVKIPRNVTRAVYVTQTTNIPKGHKLIAEDSANTTIHHAGVLPQTHQTIDHCGAWYDLVQSELEQWANKTFLNP